MGLEAVSFLDDLVVTNPGSGDDQSEGDDHIRNIKTALKATFPGMGGRAWRVQVKSSGYTITAADNMSVIRCTTALTLAVTAAATLGNGFVAIVEAASGDVIVDPSASEQINGAATVTIPSGYTGLLRCDGSAFVVFGLLPLSASSARSLLSVYAIADVYNKTETYTKAEVDAAIDADIAAIVFPLPMIEMRGLTLSNNGADATNDLDIAAGRCRDASNAVNLILSSALTKRLDATWVTGTNQGGRSSSQALANGTWHVFLMRVSGVDDVGFDTSASGANLVTDHSATHLRRIGSILRESAAIVGFVQDGDRFRRNLGKTDVSSTHSTGSRTTYALSVPTGVRVKAFGGVFQNSNGANTCNTYVSDLSQPDNSPIPDMSGAYHGDSIAGWGAGAYFECMTNTSAQVGVRGGLAVSFSLYTHGWYDTRGRFA